MERIKRYQRELYYGFSRKICLEPVLKFFALICVAQGKGIAFARSLAKNALRFCSEEHASRLFCADDEVKFCPDMQLSGKILPKLDASQMAQLRSNEQFATRTFEKPKRLRVKEPQIFGSALLRRRGEAKSGFLPCGILRQALVAPAITTKILQTFSE